MEKSTINKRADALAKAERINKLREKYEYRTEAERLEPIKRVLFNFSFLLQLISATLAAGGVLLLIDKFAPTFKAVAVVVVVLLAFLEFLKRLSYDIFNRQRIAKEQLNKIVVFFCGLFACLSVGSSYVGAPYTVEYFASSPALVDTSLIVSNYTIIESKEAEKWLKLSKDATKKAEEIHARNNWKGVTSRHARPAQLAAVERSAGYKDSLVTNIQRLKAEQRAAIAAALSENKQIKADFNAWRQSFGFWLALASIFFELSFFGILFWCANHEGREIKEYQAEEAEQPKERSKKAVKDDTKNDTKDEVFSTKEPQNAGFAIGFHKDKDEDQNEPKDGVIIWPEPPKVKPRILVPIEGGKRKAYTAGQLQNLINGSNPQRAAELKQYLTKIKSL